MKKKTMKQVITVPWNAPVIDIGVHYCVEKLHAPGEKDHGKKCRFWYALDLTSYNVGDGATPMKAIEGLLDQMWAIDDMAAEFKAKGHRVVRERLHKRYRKDYPEAISEMKRDIRKWKGHIIKGVNWKKWHKKCAK